MESLEEKLRRQKEDLDAQKVKESASLTQKLSEQQKLNQEKVEQEVRTQIVEKKAQIIEAHKKIEALKAPRKSELLAEELKKEEKELQEMQEALNASVKTVVQLFQTYRKTLAEMNVSSVSQMMEVNADAPEVMHLKEQIQERKNKVLQKNEVKEKMQQAQKEDAPLSPRDTMIAAVEKDIATLEEEVAMLAEQLPERKEEYGDRFAEEILTKLDGQAHDSATKFLHELQKQQLPDTYDSYMKKPGYGEVFLQDACAKAPKKYMEQRKEVQELLKHEELLASIDVSAEEKHALEEQIHQTLIKMKEVNKLIGEKVRPREKTLAVDSGEKDFLNRYLSVRSNILEKAGKTSVLYFEDTFHTLKNTIGKSFGNPPRFTNVKQVQKGVEELNQLLEELMLVHTQDNTQHPLHCTQMLSLEDMEAQASTKYIKEHYNDIFSLFASEIYASDWLQNSSLEYKRTRVDELKSKMHVYEEKVAEEYRHIPEYVADDVEYAKLREQYGSIDALMGQQEIIGRSAQDAQKKLKDIVVQGEKLQPFLGESIYIIEDTNVNLTDLSSKYMGGKQQSEIKTLEVELENMRIQKIGFFGKILGKEKVQEEAMMVLEKRITDLHDQIAEYDRLRNEYLKLDTQIKELLNPLKSDLEKMIDQENPEFRSSIKTVGDLLQALSRWYTKKAEASFPQKKIDAMNRMTHLEEKKEKRLKRLDGIEKLNPMSEIQREFERR